MRANWLELCFFQWVWSVHVENLEGFFFGDWVLIWLHISIHVIQHIENGFIGK